MPPPIFLLTDFGTNDPFVGIMKAVILGIHPDSELIDLTHEVPAGDIRSGAVLLWQALPFLPEGSVVLCVVDPGVGTERRPILLQSGGIDFIGPDNGIFSYILEEGVQAWELRNPDLALTHKGTTFHGRDIFAPAAAHTAAGIPPPSFGPPVEELVQIPPPLLECQQEGKLYGEIIHTDRFGNALTSLGQFIPLDQGGFELHPWSGSCQRIKIDLPHSQLQLPSKVRLNWAVTFAEIPPNDYCFVLGSSGLLEIAADRQSAAEGLHLVPGDRLTLIY
jgi:S-adenosylmethionine hydrolase